MVYIVEDDSSVRKGLSRLMRSADLPSQDFATAEDFLAKVDAHEPSCVLLDLTMPELSGLQLQVELNKRHLDLPVIVVSARDDSDTREMARRLGARFFFRKPVDDQALIDAIQWILAPQQKSPTRMGS